MVVAILALGAAPVNTGAVRGEILDANTGQALTKSHLRLIYDHDSTTIKQIVTETGKFMITGLPAGTYHVVAYHADYESFTSEPFKIKANETATVNLRLRTYLTDHVPLLREVDTSAN